MSFWLVFRNSKILRLGLFLIAFFSLYYILKLGLFGGHGGLDSRGFHIKYFENKFCSFVGLPTKSGIYVSLVKILPRFSLLLIGGLFKYSSKASLWNAQPHHKSWFG